MLFMTADYHEFMALMGRSAGSIRNSRSYVAADHFRVEADAKQTGTIRKKNPDAGDADCCKQRV